MRIYVSSTYQDLIEYRRTVIDSIWRSWHTPVCMEYHAADDVIPKDECIRELATCDLYIGIFAWRYGFIHPQDDISITETEYREALKRNICTKIFLLDENAEWPGECRDASENGRRIRELREELQLTKWVSFFTNPDELAKKVLEAISAEINKGMEQEYSKAQTTTLIDKERQRKALKSLQDGQSRVEHIRGRKKRENVSIPIPERLIRHFQDRESELATLRQCLRNKNLRLVLICGRGGMGKTALAAKLASELMENINKNSPARVTTVDSILFVPLGESGYRSPDRIVELISHSLESEAAVELDEIWNQEGASLRERLTAVFCGPLRYLRCLIILDNLESVLDCDNRISQEFEALRQFVDVCLELDHHTLLIATSRRSLALSTSAEIAAIGRRVQLSLDEGLPKNHAIALLRELDSDGNLCIRDATSEVLRQVVRRCQCIPRTLEILVGTLLQRPTWNLDSLLKDEPLFARLVEDPARERYASLVSDRERLVMQALAVFNRPVPAAAVSFLLPALPVDEILDKFVRNFIATYDRERFWLHPLDRQYAYNQIPALGAEYSKSVLHKKAAQFYERLRKPQDHWKTIDDLEPQLEEFRHLVRAEQYDNACHVLNEIDREYLATWGHSQLIIELRSLLLGNIKDHELRGLNLGNLGAAYFESGMVATAVECYKLALEIARETKSRINENRWLGNLGLAYNNLSIPSKAISFLSEALDIAIDIHDRLHIGRWLGNLTSVRSQSAQLDNQEAIKKYLEAIDTSREVEDWRFVMNWASNVGDIYATEGDFGKAKEQYECACDSARRIGAYQQTCIVLIKLVDLHRRLGEEDLKDKYYKQTIEVVGEMYSSANEARVLIQLGNVYANLGKQQEQLQCYHDALDMAHDKGDKYIEHLLLLMIGDIYAKLGEKEHQKEYYQNAFKVACETDSRSDDYAALLRLARMYLEWGQAGEAANRFEQALLIACEAGDHAGEAVVLSGYADMLLNFGEATKAIGYYERALPYVEEMNDTASRLFVLNRLGMASYFLHDAAKAISYYEQTLMIARDMHSRENEAIALFNVGDAYHLLGKFSDAIPYYKEALAFDNQYINYKCEIGLGISYLFLNQAKEAQNHFEKAIKIHQEMHQKDPRYSPWRPSLGLSLLGIGKTQDGLNAYSHWLELSPSKEHVHYSIQDLQVLKQAPQDIAGLDEAINLLESAMSADHDFNV